MVMFLDRINARVSIAGRMRILAILMVLPVVFAGYFLVRSHLDVIDVAQVEIAGSNDLSRLWPMLTTGATGGQADDGAAQTLAADAGKGILTTDQALALDKASGGYLMRGAYSLIL